MARAFSHHACWKTALATTAPADTGYSGAPTQREPQCMPVKPAAPSRAAVTPLAAMRARGPPERKFRRPQKSEPACTQPGRVPEVRLILSILNAMPHNVKMTGD